MTIGQFLRSYSKNISGTFLKHSANKIVSSFFVLP